jgi:hypothetical protein
LTQFIAAFTTWFKTLSTVEAAEVSDETIRKIALHLKSDGYADRHAVSQFDSAMWLEVLTEANTANNLGLFGFPKKGHLRSLQDASSALKQTQNTH